MFGESINEKQQSINKNDKANKYRQNIGNYWMVLEKALQLMHFSNFFNFSAKIVQTERNTKRKAKRFSLGIAEVQPILSKDSANERNIKIKTQFLILHSRVPPILSKDNQKPGNNLPRIEKNAFVSQYYIPDNFVARILQCVSYIQI